MSGLPAQAVDTALPRDAATGLPTSTAPFLGWSGDDLRFGSVEDSVGIVGPPRYGKTSGLVIPACLMWAGSLV